MINQTIFRTKILIPGVAVMIAACNSSLQIPDDSGDDGIPVPAGQGQDQIPGPGLPPPGQVGSTESAGSGEIEGLEEIFDRSLGDFDDELGQEQAGMSSGGIGSTQSAERRESRDARTAAKGQSGKGKRVGVPSSDQSGSQSDGIGNENSGDDVTGELPGDSQQSPAGEAGGQQTGSSDYEGPTEKTKDGASELPAHKIPKDVVANTSNEDKVAEQIREAAMAEDDPMIRDALWEEYRRHTGLENER